MPEIYDARIANLNADLATLTSMSSEYQDLTSRSLSSSSQKTAIQGKIQALNAKISDIASATSTYEKEFLDRRQGAPVLYRRLQTLQDIVLAAFFFSYFLISLTAVFYVWRTYAIAGNAPMYAGTTAVVMTLLGIVIGEIIRRYA
jgi:hypothetical protein